MISDVNAPTPYDGLNEVLAELVAGVEDALGANFCGAYLQGSFALGDADRHSDVDFIVATNDQLSDSEQSALQHLHARLYALDIDWAQHLEGSYVPKRQLRRVDPSGASFFYLDNGASELVWDSHCNTAFVRWSLREHGIVLAGPAPRELVGPVSVDDLRDEALTRLAETAAWAQEQHELYCAGNGLMFSRWVQPYLVISFCRLLRTLSLGDVVSKREAGEWALRTLDGRWTGLIQRALDDRPDPWQRVRQAADPAAVAETIEFVWYALSAAGVPA